MIKHNYVSKLKSAMRKNIKKNIKKNIRRNSKMTKRERVIAAIEGKHVDAENHQRQRLILITQTTAVKL